MESLASKFLDLPEPMINLILSELDDQASVRSTCRPLRDTVFSNVKSLTWREGDLNVLPAGMLSKCEALRSITFARPDSSGYTRTLSLSDLQPLTALYRTLRRLHCRLVVVWG